MIKILHIFGRMSRGGAEMRTLDLMRCLPAGCFRLEFCVLSGSPGELDEEILRLGGCVHYLKLKHLFFPFKFLRLLRSQRYDVVHSHVHYFSGFILMLAHLAGVRHRIAHFRNTSDGKAQTFARRIQSALMRYWIDKHATSILAVCNGAMEESWGKSWHYDKRCAVIPNGLDTRPFQVDADPGSIRQEFGIPRNSQLIVHVGRMVREKNHVKIAAILGRLLIRKPYAYALFVGREDLEIKDAIDKYFLEHGILNRVRYAGIRGDVPRILLGADLLLFPSLWEGLPGVVLEACAAGTPVLASDLPGIKEIASVFNDLRILNTNAPDRLWVENAEELLAMPVNSIQRREALLAFRKTVFSIERCLASHFVAWSGGNGASIMSAIPVKET